MVHDDDDDDIDDDDVKDDDDVVWLFSLYQFNMTDCNDWWCDTGVHQRPGDLEVNVCKTKALTNMRASGIDDILMMMMI